MKIEDELIGCGKSLLDKGLVWGRSGNISVRVGSDSFLISAGGSELGYLKNGDVVLCRVGDESYEGGRKPSMEAGLHRGIYNLCPEAEAIIHSQPFYSTLVACSDIELRVDFLPEAMAYLDEISLVPYHHAGSKALAEATSACAKDSRVLLLRNHGVVCWGSSLEEALAATETLEFVCRLLVASRASGIDINYLGIEAIKDFKEHLENINR